MENVCFNPWNERDREKILNLSIRFLNGWMAEELAKDEISVSQYKKIINEAKVRLAWYESDRIGDAFAIAYGTEDAIKAGREKTKDDILWVGLDDAEFYKKVLKDYVNNTAKVFCLKRLLDYLRAYKCP